jgi:hypothetical protein
MSYYYSANDPQNWEQESAEHEQAEREHELEFLAVLEDDAQRRSAPREERVCPKR